MSIINARTARYFNALLMSNNHEMYNQHVVSGVQNNEKKQDLEQKCSKKNFNGDSPFFSLIHGIRIFEDP